MSTNIEFPQEIAIVIWSGKADDPDQPAEIIAPDDHLGELSYAQNLMTAAVERTDDDNEIEVEARVETAEYATGRVFVARSDQNTHFQSEAELVVEDGFQYAAKNYYQYVVQKTLDT